MLVIVHEYFHMKIPMQLAYVHMLVARVHGCSIDAVFWHWFAGLDRHEYTIKELSYCACTTKQNSQEHKARVRSHLLSFTDSVSIVCIGCDCSSITSNSTQSGTNAFLRTSHLLLCTACSTNSLASMPT